MNLAVAAIPNGHRAPPCSTNASPPASVQRLERTPVEFFFCLFITRMRPYEIMARLCTVRFLSAVRAVAARCKHPFCSPPRPVPRICSAHQGNYKRKERRVSMWDKGKNEGKNTASRLSRSCGRHEGGRGRNSGVPPAPSSPAPAPAPCSFTHSRTSSSDTVLTASSSSAGTACPRP